MSDMKKFRKSVNGYRKSDVTAYLKTLTAEQESVRREWDTQMERARREAEESRERLAAVQRMADELASELYRAQKRAETAEKKADELAAEVYAAGHQTGDGEKIARLEKELADCRRALEEKETMETRLKHTVMSLSDRVEKSETPARPVAVIHAKNMRGKR